MNILTPINKKKHTNHNAMNTNFEIDYSFILQDKTAAELIRVKEIAENILKIITNKSIDFTYKTPEEANRMLR